MSSGKLAGQVALVTGAGNGIGRGSAQRLAAEGARLVVVDIDGDAAARVAAELPGEAMAVTADVSDEAQVDACTEAAVAAFGRIDLHHLNAGIFGTFAPVPDLPAQEFDRVLAVNVRGQFLGLRAAFRQFRAQGRPAGGPPGAIVLTASIASLTGSADLLAYQASKHATLGLMHGAAMYGGPLGIRVNAVAPGIVPTDLFAAAASTAGGKNDMTQRAATTPLRRAGTPADIGAVVAFLLSADAAYMTGQVVSVDGGATIVNTVRPSGGAGAWDPAAVDAALYGASWNWSGNE
ncbi:MAG TPA: glucose 1-dehydrogenase [Trebonia sp.]|jgi:NAD(P)-dependent dehydrogenase (short-subunit alcohol dehydrogenase family)|nr:glucose 1-dehydrogenase [Trebonia sp.]